MCAHEVAQKPQFYFICFCFYFLMQYFSLDSFPCFYVFKPLSYMFNCLFVFHMLELEFILCFICFDTMNTHLHAHA